MKNKEMTNCKVCAHHEICTDKISCGVLKANKDGFLKLVCKYYQPKLSEYSVVLSREEYQKDFSNQFNKGYKHGSKEMAEKIYWSIRQKCYKSNDTGYSESDAFSSINWAIKEVLKEQAGIEIKE